MSITSYNFSKLKRQYFIFSLFQKKYLKINFEKHLVKKWTKVAKQRFTDLLPEIPYIGGKENYFTKFLIMTAMLTPIVQILHEEKIPERTIGLVIFGLAEGFYGLLPRIVRRKQGRKLFTEESKNDWQCRCQASQELDQPFDWVCDFVEGGERKDFVYGFNMTRCGNVDFWKAQGLEQYTPYICLVDWPGWKANEVIASRTQTLAHGTD